MPELDTLQDCDFCAIGRGEDPTSAIVCKSETWVAFFPLKPATPGHTLVIPRRHVIDLWSAGPELVGELAAGAVKVGRAIDVALQPDGMNLITSAGRTAEQTVFHLHLHVVPRWEDDRFGRIWPKEPHYARAELGDYAERIRTACSATDCDSP